MATHRHYSKAPITEAIIDLRVKLPEGTTLSALERLGASQQEAYPTKKDRYLARGTIDITQQATIAAASQQIGYLFISRDERQIFQANLEGFTMSRLAPYESWEPFCREARRLWNVYRADVRPEKVLRLAVRYINRLDLPGPKVEITDYLRTGPQISPALPQALGGFLMQVSIAQEDIKSTLLLNETNVSPAPPGFVSIILDIDLFRELDVPTDEEGMWRLFEDLHDRKNDIFEACITDRTRELIQ